jgi:hypothetical protein
VDDGSDDSGLLELIAYHRGPGERVRIVPSARWRDWMNATNERFANRCLPLLMANEAGWTLLNPRAFTATWTGGPHWRDLRIEYDDPDGQRPLAESNFGYGIISWGVPVLFRTPPGYNLLARGPANLPKDGASALEGLVETDWSVATFTMNWKLTRPDHPVRFETGEPFCMLIPQRRGELEAVRPVHRDLSTLPAVRAGVKRFEDRREDLQKRKFIADFVGRESEAWDEWEASYFRGREADGASFSDHQTKLRLREFNDDRVSGTPRGSGPIAGPEPEVEQIAPQMLALTFGVSEFVRFRSFRSGTIVLDLRDGGHFELNPVAGRMLELVADGHPVEKTAGIIARRYGQPTTLIQRDVALLTGQLVELGILERAGMPDAAG